ncbi:alpha-L-rhamnosidase C-terminal domain-containing protein [Cerasicoccus fimbriatus]|uniref:alpha-L-rhamnosidase-related protein n=1 Tax=Cerasicoccus fimbriatus TaxID=3014554 RepID=UPI0022B5344F|nr:alpha-L-rhamnosidase C-terminal domain-containing protein [Cerasicoccus sp. TK19100]
MSHPDFRFTIPPIKRLAGDANLQIGHPADQSSWVWASGKTGRETAFIEFSLEFDWAHDRPLEFHVTADQRFQLYLDGKDVAFGPDRSDVAHWPVSSLSIPVEPGRHVLKVLVWTLPLASDPTPSPDELNPLGKPLAIAPMAQMSYRGGFLLCAAELEDFALLNTGEANWLCRDVTPAVSMKRVEGLSYHDIGPSFTVDLDAWASDQEPKPAVVIRSPLQNQKTGVLRDGWVLDATYLPEQKRERLSGGKIRAVRGASDDAWQEGGDDATADWQGLLCDAKSVVVPANSEVDVLWDFEEYRCGYPYFEGQGGDASIDIEWAESLYHREEGKAFNAHCMKGNRSEIAGKFWLGFGDVFTLPKSVGSVVSPLLWWRSGRYIRLRIKTGSEPLTLTRLEVVTTGYPYQIDAKWDSSDAEWNDVMQLMATGLEAAAHETWTDCPYYEQMMYVGDTRLHGLSNYACYEDDRLTRRAIELFDWSRLGSVGELISERYPCHLRQESCTYAMMWVWMVHDFLMWRDDFDFVRARLIGIRSFLETMFPLITNEGVLGPIPGWPFVDWDRGWDTGCGPGVREGDSSILSLHLVLTLKAAAEIEAAVGEPLMQQRYLEKAKELMDATIRVYWDSDRNLLLDSRMSSATSEHAHALALLTELLSEDHEAACLEALLNADFDAHCTIYFSHYLLEVLARYGQSEAYFEKLKFWRGLPAQGFVSLPEAPEPSRSDCHGWGAHPMFHSYASVAGVRPGAPGFAKIRVQPMPGPLENFRAEMPHPCGEIVVTGQRREGRMVVEVSAPAGVEVDLDETYCF